MKIRIDLKKLLVENVENQSETSKVPKTNKLHQENKTFSKINQEKGKNNLETTPKIPADSSNFPKKLEASSKGTVNGSLLVNYFKATNRPFALVFLLVAFPLTQILLSLADIWVGYW